MATEETPAQRLTQIAEADPTNSSDNGQLNWLVNSAMMRLGHMPPSYALNAPPPSFAGGGEVGAVIDFASAAKKALQKQIESHFGNPNQPGNLDQLRQRIAKYWELNNPETAATPPVPPVQKADGGSVDTSQVDDDSSLRKISDIAARLGPQGGAEPRARLATGVASQLYGLNENGDPQFLGSSNFLHNPDGSISFTKGNPKFMDEVLAAPSMLGKYAPQFSTDASARLDALNRRIAQQTGVPPAHNFTDYVIDAIGTLASPIPMGSAGEKASLVKRLAELTGALRPPTAARLAIDSGILGGVNAGVEKATDMLPKKDTANALR